MLVDFSLAGQTWTICTNFPFECSFECVLGMDEERFKCEMLSMSELKCLTFSSDLLAINKEYLHSRVSQLLAGQVRFGEHDRELTKALA